MPYTQNFTFKKTPIKSFKKLEYIYCIFDEDYGYLDKTRAYEIFNARDDKTGLRYSDKRFFQIDYITLDCVNDPNSNYFAYEEEAKEALTMLSDQKETMPKSLNIKEMEKEELKTKLATYPFNFKKTKINGYWEVGRSIYAICTLKAGSCKEIEKYYSQVKEYNVNARYDDSISYTIDQNGMRSWNSCYFFQLNDPAIGFFISLEEAKEALTQVDEVRQQLQRITEEKHNNIDKLPIIEEKVKIRIVVGQNVYAIRNVNQSGCFAEPISYQVISYDEITGKITLSRLDNSQEIIGVDYDELLKENSVYCLDYKEAEMKIRKYKQDAGEMMRKLINSRLNKK